MNSLSVNEKYGNIHSSNKASSVEAKPSTPEYPSRSVSASSSSAHNSQSDGGYDGKKDKKKSKGPSRVTVPVLSSPHTTTDINIRRRRMLQLRMLFVSSLVVTVVICTSISYTKIRDLEVEIGYVTYEGVAELALQSARSLMLRKIEGAEVMAGILSRAFPNATQWPMVGLNGFAATASEIASVSGGPSIALISLVQPEDAEEFEKHAKQHYIDQGYPEGSGTSEIGFGIRRKNSDGETVFDREGNYTVYGSKNTILTPVLDHSTPGSPMLMYNVHVSSTAVDSIIECSKTAANLSLDPTNSPNCSVVTGFKMSTDSNLVGLVYKPIYPQNDPTTLVGMVGLSVNFNDVLVNSIPHYYYGAVAVISTRTKTTDHTVLDYDTVTYDIVSGVPKLRGEGDLHNPKFDDHAKSIVLNDDHTDATDEVVYTLTIYPSTFDQFRTQNPWIVVIGFVCVIMASTMIFFVYDYLMRRQSTEQALILDLKRRFVRFISHEIRTPLNTVCMGLELLENDIKLHSRRILEGKNPGSHNDSSTSFSDHDLTSDVTAADVEAWYEITHDIQENASSAVMILNDLLNYDKIENGTLQLEVGDVEIISLVEKNVHKFQLQATNKKITLSFRVNACRCGTFQEYHPGNGSALFQPRNAVVFGDEMRLGQVVGNLISNAIKFTPSGGNIEVWMDHLSPPDCAPSRQSNEQLKDHVVSSDRERRGSVVISVKDSGAGMTQDQLALMFSEGIQFDRNKLQAGGGSGLGLCISKGIVDRHDGYIRAFSDGPGLGSTFTVELPFYANDIEFQSEDEGSVASSSCPHTEKTGSATTQNTVYESMKVCATALTSEANLSPICPNFSSQAHEQQLQPRHILVVEDVPSSQKMLVRLLQRAGHTCEVAWNGREAVDLVKASMKTHDNFDVEEGNVAQTFDTILMDFEMPLMNGPDATEEIRKLGFQNLIVGVTGNVLDEDVKHFVSKGADTVLGKPVGMARLNEVFASPHLHHRASTSLNRAMLAKLDSVDISTTKKRSP